MNNNNVGKLKPIDRKAREQIREQFIKRASEPPIVNPFDAESIHAWDGYILEMRELELQLREAGEQL